MTVETPFVSRYDARVKLIEEAVTANSKLKEKDAAALAVHILRAIDSAPEKIR
ncbi:DUF6307 family protein [Amycolatopsis albispora]|uniref:DUF6307 family protein n=1 Tax=Amycolatopsis albispora TaxID=1804986 RepID=UPI0019665B53|nr:DUF6307 family protein [Amycolatopsis albispora]